MANPKLKKFPKTPKAGASVATLESFKKKCDEISKENVAKLNASKAEKAKKKALLDGAVKAKERSNKAKV